MNEAIQSNELVYQSSGRGGARNGAGRKSSIQHKADSIRVDLRLFPFLQWTKKNGLTDEIINTLNNFIDDRFVPPPPSINLIDELSTLYKIPSKNRKRTAQNKIKSACIALGFDETNLNYNQQKAVINYHKELRK